jgi:carbonic anhydrase
MSAPTMARTGLAQLSFVLLLFVVTARIVASKSDPQDRQQIFSYDPDAEFGPPRWGNLDIPDNQCNASKNSPINIRSSPCTIVADYSFQVSCSV